MDVGHTNCLDVLLFGCVIYHAKKFNSILSALMGEKKRKSNWQKRFAAAMNGT